MGQAFVDDTQQSGPRGGDKFYSSSWFMTSAEHAAGAQRSVSGRCHAESGSCHHHQPQLPAIVSNRRNRLWAPPGGRATPAQFRHGSRDSTMRANSGSTLWDVYFAPVGDPALGPVAFPHRASAMELPQATISHHLQDSTHVADEVITAGISRGKVRLEASGFYGTEPGKIAGPSRPDPSTPGRPDSGISPAAAGRRKYPREESRSPRCSNRETSSNHGVPGVRPAYFHGSWASSLIWGRTHNTLSQLNLNSYLVESVLPVGRKNFLTGRIELADKDELIPQLVTAPPSALAHTPSATRATSLSGAPLKPESERTSTSTRCPMRRSSYYGDHPAGGNIFHSLPDQANGVI